MNPITTLQFGNQLVGLETNKPVQPQDVINFIKNELTKLDKHNPGYAVKIEKLYSINNMPDELKDKLLEKYRDINVEHDWYFYVCDDWTEQLKTYGFNNAKINFTGFWSQGDGASFTADVDLETYLKAHKLGNKYRAALLAAKVDMVKLEIYRICHHYSHANTISARSEYFGEDTIVEAQLNELNEQILKRARDLSKAIYHNLENDYNNLTSNDSILETLEANGYIFKYDGKNFGYY